MTSEAAMAATLSRGAHDRRATVLRAVRRAAVCSAVATGALVAFAAPSWAGTSSSPADDTGASGASVTSTDARPGDDAAAAKDATGAIRTDAGSQVRGIATGLTDGLHTLGLHTLGLTHSPDRASDTQRNTQSNAQAEPPDEPTSPQPASLQPTSMPPAPPSPADVDQTSTSTATPADTATTATPVRSADATTHAPARTPDVRSSSDTQPVSKDTPTDTSADTGVPTAPKTSPTNVAATTSPRVSGDGTSPNGAPTILPISVLTDTLASTLEAPPAAVTHLTDGAVDTVDSLTTSVDDLSHGLTTPVTNGIVVPVLTTTSTVLDDVVTSTGDRVIEPAAHLVRDAGASTQTGVDSAVGALAPLIQLGGAQGRTGGSSASGSSAAEPTGPDGSTEPVGAASTDGDQATTDASATTGQPDAIASVPLTAPTLGSPLGALSLGTLLMSGGRPAGMPSDAPYADRGEGPTGSAVQRTMPTTVSAEASTTGGGFDQKLPVGHDETPTDGGAGQGHGAAPQIGLDSASTWLPGAARSAVFPADSWRVPGSLTLEPGHSPD